MASNPPTLPPNIEIFRAGTHTADNGTQHTFTAADVVSMVSAYDPKVHEAPLCVGHPQDNKPAYGWVKSLAVASNGTLVMDTHNVATAFAEAVDSKAFKKRSASFYPPSHPQNPKQGSWYLRHVAFLGAHPPAIKGLADFTESNSGAAEDGCVNFSEAIFTPPPPPKKDENMDEIEKLKQQLAAANAEKEKAAADAKAAAEASAASDKKLAEFKEAQHKANVAEFTAMVEKSNVKPADKAAAVAVLTALSTIDAPVSFSEGNAVKTVSPLEFAKSLIGALPAPVQFGEHMPAGAGGGNSDGGINGLTEAQIEQKIQNYKEKHNVSYDKAFAVVCSFTQGA